MAIYTDDSHLQLAQLFNLMDESLKKEKKLRRQADINHFVNDALMGEGKTLDQVTMGTAGVVPIKKQTSPAIGNQIQQQSPTVPSFLPGASNINTLLAGITQKTPPAQPAGNPIDDIVNHADRLAEKYKDRGVKIKTSDKKSDGGSNISSKTNFNYVDDYPTQFVPRIDPETLRVLDFYAAESAKSFPVNERGKTAVQEKVENFQRNIANASTIIGTHIGGNNWLKMTPKERIASMTASWPLQQGQLGFHAPAKGTENSIDLKPKGGSSGSPPTTTSGRHHHNITYGDKTYLIGDNSLVTDNRGTRYHTADGLPIYSISAKAWMKKDKSSWGDDITLGGKKLSELNGANDTYRFVPKSNLKEFDVYGSNNKLATTITAEEFRNVVKDKMRFVDKKELSGFDKKQRLTEDQIKNAAWLNLIAQTGDLTFDLSNIKSGDPVSGALTVGDASSLAVTTNEAARALLEYEELGNVSYHNKRQHLQKMNNYLKTIDPTKLVMPTTTGGVPVTTTELEALIGKLADSKYNPTNAENAMLQALASQSYSLLGNLKNWYKDRREN